MVMFIMHGIALLNERKMKMKTYYEGYFIEVADADVQGYLGYSHVFYADGYCGAIDSEDYRSGYGDSIDDCIYQIKEQILEHLGVTV